MRLMTLLAIVLFATVPAIRAEEKPDPRATVESALDQCIALMEKKEIAKFFKECIVQQDLEKVLKENNKTSDDFLKFFSTPEGEAGIKEALANWKAFKTKTPTYNEAKTEATFPVLIMNGTETGLVFEKHNNLWLMNMSKSATSKKEIDEVPK